MTSGVAMATIDVDRLVAGNDVGSKGLRAPLLVWLVGKDVKETAKLLRDTLVTKDSEKQVFERFNVWCMLELVAMIGDSKIFKMSPEKDSDDCWRDDMDGLASVNKENEFLHYLFNRLQTPNGFNPGDVVVLFGNLLLDRLPSSRATSVLSSFAWTSLTPRTWHCSSRHKSTHSIPSVVLASLSGWKTSSLTMGSMSAIAVEAAVTCSMTRYSP